jgi:hypothetical protein
MDLNVKLQGVKYNFEKVQGCFCKILKCRRFSGFTDLFSLRESRRICPRDCGPGPPASAHRSMGFIKRRSLIQRSASRIYHRERVSPGSNLGRTGKIGRRGGWLRSGAVRARAHGGAPWSSMVAHRSSGFLEPW